MPRLRLDASPPVAAVTIIAAEPPFTLQAPFKRTPEPHPVIPALRPPSEPPSRWSGSAWLFVREGGPQGLAAGGTLGGSQGGARLTYRLNDDVAVPLALSARAYVPVDAPEAAEGAAGIDWQPVRSLPVHLLAERRQALSDEGRSAFSLTAYGGVSDEHVGPFRLDAYAQAGVVGARSRDLFADGSAKLSIASGRAKAGVGA